MTTHLRVISTLFLVALFMQPILAATLQHPAEIPHAGEHDGQHPFTTAGTNLTRVDWTTNHIPNGGFESWSAPHDLDSLNSYRTVERYAWYAMAPSPVSEGLRSFGMEVRAIDPDHPSELIVTKSSWTYWNNPANLTLKFDFFVDEIPDPGVGDAFYVHVEMGSPARHLYYYMSGSAQASNSSYKAYFTVNADTGSWQTFDANLTRDFIDAFGVEPTTFRQFQYYLYGISSDYARTFIDDVWLVNSSYVQIGGSQAYGDFETGGTGPSWYYIRSDPSDISQSSIRTQGDWSLNITSLSIRSSSQAYVYTSPYKRITSLNPGILRFNWRIEALEHSTDDVYAYVYVECSNGTGQEFALFYPLSYGGSSFPVSGSSSVVIHPDGFNSTGVWNLFERNPYEDVAAFNATDDLFVERIMIRVNALVSRITLLVDELSFNCSIVNDMSYEDQPEPGEPVHSWGWSSIREDPHLTVTDVARTGEKAANLTLTDGDEYYGSQGLSNLPFTNATELYLDWNWRVEEFTENDYEGVVLGVYFDDTSMGYVMANGSGMENGDFDEYVPVATGASVGTWVNTQRNLVEDYVSAFGQQPNGTIEGVVLIAYSDTGGHVEILLDDLYVYTDPAPALSDLAMTPTAPVEGQNVTVNVTAYDPSLDTVVLHYRVNASQWIPVQMSGLTETNFTASIPAQSLHAVVEFYVTANDTFGKIATLSNGSDYFGYVVASAPTTTTTSTTTTTTTTTSATTTTTSSTTTETTTSATTTGNEQQPDAVLIVVAVAVVAVVALVAYGFFRKTRA